jgi:hypothetical protein
MTDPDIRTINLGGIAYDVAQFSPGVQQAVKILGAIRGDLAKSQLEVIKCQSAAQVIEGQIAEAVQAELAAKAEPKADAKAAD